MNEPLIIFLFTSILYKTPLLAVWAAVVYCFLQLKDTASYLMLIGQSIVLALSMYSMIMAAIYLSNSDPSNQPVERFQFTAIGYLIGGMMFAAGFFMMIRRYINEYPSAKERNEFI